MPGQMTHTRPMGMRRVRMSGVAAIALALAAGCGSPFPPDSLVERLRVLAVQADPPEVGLEGSVALSALVADPGGGGRPLVFTWALCFVELTYSAQDLPCPGPDSYPIAGAGATAALSLPEVLSWLQARGLPGDLPIPEDLTELPLLLGLRVEAGTEAVRAIKRLTLRLAGTEEANANPRWVEVVPLGDAPGWDGLTLPAGASLKLRPEIDPASRQRYRRPGESLERTEEFLFSWFTTAGEFEDTRTILAEDSPGLDLNTWTAPEEPGPVTFWVVARDGRNGISWLQRSLEVR